METIKAVRLLPSYTGKLSGCRDPSLLRLEFWVYTVRVESVTKKYYMCSVSSHDSFTR